MKCEQDYIDLFKRMEPKSGEVQTAEYLKWILLEIFMIRKSVDLRNEAIPQYKDRVDYAVDDHTVTQEIRPTRKPGRPKKNE